MKKSILALMCFACVGIAKAQDYYHGIGIQANIGLFSAQVNASDPLDKDRIGLPGAFYKATLAFEIDRSLNFAVSTYPLIGMSGSYNTQTGASPGASLGFELPLLAEVYFGDIEENCFFVGAGFSASFMTSTYGSGSIIGPQAELGGKFMIVDLEIGLRATYTLGVNTPGFAKSYEKYGNNQFAIGFFYGL